MYNCLRFCQRLVNPFSLEAIPQFIAQNGSIYSNKRIIPRYFNAVSSVSERSRIDMTEQRVPDRVSNFDELVSYIGNLRRIPIKQISKLFTAIRDDDLTEKQVMVLLECCSKTTSSDNIISKHNLCQTVLTKFELGGKFSEKVYECYINICTENKQCLDVKSLISSLGSNITQNLLKLILKNVCEYGDNIQALDVLAEMKKRGYTVDEEVFNYLILAHTIKGGLSSGLQIVQTMNMAKFKESSDTYFFLIKGLIQRDNLKEFTEALDQYEISYREYMILSLLDALGFRGNPKWAKFLTKYINRSLLSRYFVIEIERLCIDLVRNSKYDAAFEIYKVFLEEDLNGTYGNNILTEMLLCSVPVEKIIEFAKELKESGVNEYALESVTGMALKNKLFKQALKFFDHLDTMKPHYFWPMLMQAYSENGEIGLLDVVETVHSMNIKFDSDSFLMYIFPQCNLRSPQRVLTMFQEMGYTVRELLSPMIGTLLRKKKIYMANELCETYKNVIINPDDILQSLSFTWLSTVDHEACLKLLQKISESHNEEYIGKFLIDVLKNMKGSSRLKPFVELLKEFKKRNLIISTASADTMLNILRKNSHSHDLMLDVEGAINDIIDFSKISTEQYFIHPRDMTIDELELHLIELKSKGMETRGVLRKLIQKYSGQGQRQRVKELREELTAKGYVASPGMKSSMMYTHVQEGELEEAMKIYEELIQSSRTFKMDNFKIVNLATLLVQNDQYDKAVEILKTSGIHNLVVEPVSCWERNCLNLLKSIQDMDLQQEMFNILLQYKYCEATNILLGSIVQLHLEKDTLENTVDLFLDITKKYNKTPMQVVLLARIVGSGKDELLQKVLEGTAAVHGHAAARSALVAAMCEKGFVKQVVTILQGYQTYPTKEVQKRCERWVHTGDMKALKTMLAASKELPEKLLNIPKIQLSIMKLYSKRNDCDGALEFWKSIVNEEDHVDTDVDNEFCELLNRCKFNSPENLSMKYKIK